MSFPDKTINPLPVSIMNRRFCCLAFTCGIFHLFLSTSFLCLDAVYADGTKNDFNVVLITIDTLRADHLSCYGYERQTSPFIDSVAGKGMLFSNAYAPSSWTAPSMVSLFTSVYPVKIFLLLNRRWESRSLHLTATSAVSGSGCSFQSWKGDGIVI